jgi:hypothetical protein
MVLNRLLHQGFVITLLLLVQDVTMQEKRDQKILFFAKNVRNSKRGKKKNVLQRISALIYHAYFIFFWSILYEKADIAFLEKE